MKNKKDLIVIVKKLFKEIDGNTREMWESDLKSTTTCIQTEGTKIPELMQEIEELLKEEIKEYLMHFYEIDLDNCTFTHENWIDELAESMANPSGYLNRFLKEYEIYKSERQ